MKIMTAFLFLASLTSFANQPQVGELNCNNGATMYAENCCTCGDQIATTCKMVSQGDKKVLQIDGQTIDKFEDKSSIKN